MGYDFTGGKMKSQRKTLITFFTLLIILLFSTQLVFADREPGGPKEPTSPAGGLVVEDLTGVLTPTDLGNSLAGAGITVSNVTYTGAEVAAGGFSGGTGIIGFEDGVVLGSGQVIDVVGPNTLDNLSTANGTPGDSDLDLLSGFTTYDAAVLELDFVPNGAAVYFRYVFSSDEYNEYVNTEFNDVFAFYVNGVNCAVVDGDPITINTVNNGNPFGTLPNSNPSLYINNDCNDGGCPHNTEMDGFTVVLTCGAVVTPDATNTLKLAIADATDDIYDANVFIEGGSLTTIPTDVSLSDFGLDNGRSSLALAALLLPALLVGLVVVYRRRAAAPGK
jgi:hypothetical protein